MRERRIGVTSRTVLGLLSTLAILGAAAPAAMGGRPGSAPPSASHAPTRSDAPNLEEPAGARARGGPVPASVAHTNRVVVQWSDVRSADGPAAAAAAARNHVAAVASASRHATRFVRTTGSGTAVYELESQLGLDATRILTALRGVPGATTVEPDLWMTAEGLPNDPQAADLWGLLGAADGSPFGIDALSVWPTTTGVGVVVAVIDTGLVSHPDLAGQSVPGYDMISSPSVANDGDGRDPDASDPGDACFPRHSSWHGTHVAGTVAAVANNGIGVFGGAPGVKIQPVRVLGVCGGFATDVADGIRWAAGGTVPGVPSNPTPARVLNLSLSGSSFDCPDYFTDAIADARSHGAVVVVAAGNLASDAADSSPANCADAITVAAIDANGIRASFSNHGAGVDIAGPGVGIISTINAGLTSPAGPTYAAYNGTSMATPHVVLSAALIAAMDPSLPPDAIAAVLQSTTTAFASDPSDKSCQVLGCGSGIVNAGRAGAGLAGATPIVGRVAPAVRYPFPGSSLQVTAWAVDRTDVASAELSIDGGPWAAMTAADGAFGGISEELAATVSAPGSEGDHAICVRATDPGTNTSDGTACTTITVDAGPPGVSAPVSPAPPIDQNPVVAVTAAATDGVVVASAELSLDRGTWVPMQASDGAFGEGAEALAGAFGGGITQVSAGGGLTCALLVDTTVRCWGWNTYGQLGDGTTTDRRTPVAVAGLSDVVQIAAGGYVGCALLADTTVRCWGFNEAGALGDGTLTSSPVPVTVTGLSGVTMLAPMDQSMCALLTDATVRCWGENGNGELGDATLIDRSAPVPVSGLANVTAISGGVGHACALLVDTTVRCWGFNPYGALGDGSTTDHSTPVTVSGLSTVTELGLGLYHTCGRLANATVACWGLNNWGQLGDGTSIDHHQPVLVVGLASVAAIAIGGQNGCALLADTTARCWGSNTGGQIGDGTTADRHTPVAVAGLSGVAALVIGGADTCALMGDATARCWGINLYGELGDGTLTQRAHPVRVAGIGAISGGAHSLCVRATDSAGHTSDGNDCSPLTVAAPTALLTGPATPTKATTLSWTLTFGGAVSGLTASDFSRTGTATGCVVGAPGGSGTNWTVALTGCGQGTVALALKASSVIDAVANRGPAYAASAATVTIDRTGPTTTAPSVTPRVGAALGGTAIPVTVAATGADVGGAGIARYELARSTDGGMIWATLSTTLTTATYPTTVPASGTVRYRVRAVDRVGNVGPWTSGPVLTPLLVQQTSAAVQFSGSWATETSTAYSGGSTRASSAVGASATYTFTGRSIALIATKAPLRSKVKIYVNGTLAATIYPYAATTTYRVVVWQRTWSTSVTRSVKLVVAGPTGRRRGDLDAFAVLE